MNNRQNRSVSLRATELDPAKWPNARRALVLSTQELLDRELDSMPRREWFDRALPVQLEENQEIEP